MADDMKAFTMRVIRDAGQTCIMAGVDPGIVAADYLINAIDIYRRLGMRPDAIIVLISKIIAKNYTDKPS